MWPGVVERVSCVRTLKELCLLVLEQNGSIMRSMNISERLVVFEECKRVKKLCFDNLKILSQGGASRHFLSRYAEAELCNQPINDACLQLIYEMIPTTSEIEQNDKTKSFYVKLDFSNCLQLQKPIIECDLQRGKLPAIVLSISGCKYLETFNFVTELCCATSLQLIDLSHCRTLTSSQIGKIGNSFMNIKGITLNHCTQLEDDDLIKIIENNRKLESLSIVGCSKLTSAIIHCIMDSKITLKSISFGTSRKITIASFLKFLVVCGRTITKMRFPPHCLNPWSLTSLPYFCPSLNTLDLNYIDMRWLLLLRYPTEEQLEQTTKELISNDPESIDCFDYWKSRINRLFTGLSTQEQHSVGRKYLASLVKVDLSSIIWNDEIAAEIFPWCTSLRTVSLHSCRTIGESSFEAIVNSGSEIMSLDCGYTISSCSPINGLGSLKCEELRYLFCSSSFNGEIIRSWLEQSPRSCRKLKYISIHWSDNARDSDMTQLLERCSKSLHWLELGLCYFLTAKTMKSIALYCTNILSLDVCSVPCINDEVIDLICGNCGRLEELNIAHDSEVTDFGIESIAKKLPNLHTLKLDNLTKLTDEGIRTLCFYVRDRMKTFSIAGIRNFTDAALRDICRFSSGGLCVLSSLQFVQELNLSTHPNVTNNVVAAVSKIKFLRQLELSECPQLTGECIEYLGQCTTLESLSLANCTNLQGCSLFPILESNEGHISLQSPNNSSLSRW